MIPAPEISDQIKKRQDIAPENAHANFKPANKKSVQKASIKPQYLHKPLSESSVTILGSITTKTAMNVQRIAALAALVAKARVNNISVLVGGSLRRFNFWESAVYQEKLKSKTYFIPPTPIELTQEALGWEGAWLKDHDATLCFLQSKFGSNFQLLTWDKFKQNKEYSELHSLLIDGYRKSSNLKADIDASVDDYVKKLVAGKKLPPKDHPAHKDHVAAAKENILKYLFEEGPMVSSKALNSDYLFYPEPMTGALKAIYYFFNSETGKRWVVPD
jgi:hypothetical protein